MCGLIGDIGGTNARFALVTDGKVEQETVKKCDDYDTISDAITEYLGEIGRPDDLNYASFSVAGPVKGDAFTLTNHHWSFSVSQLKKDLDIEHAHLINDFVAVALGVREAASEHILHIGKEIPKDPKANIGVIGPGTGLGVGMMIYDDVLDSFAPAPGEGGHVTMPARTMREFELFHWLETYKYSHVSAERVCSGKGLVNVYNGLREMDGSNDLSDLEPEQITQRAISGECALCAETLDMMLAFLGRVAGNLALTITARGGIYIAGGILPKIGLDYVNQSRFRKEFECKGRFTDFMKEIPTYLVTDPFLGLKGLQADLRRIQNA